MQPKKKKNFTRWKSRGKIQDEWAFLQKKKKIVDISDQWRLVRRWQKRNGKTPQILDFWVMHLGGIS